MSVNLIKGQDLFNVGLTVNEKQILFLLMYSYSTIKENWLGFVENKGLNFFIYNIKRLKRPL